MVKKTKSKEIVKRLEQKKKDQRETISLRLPLNLIEELNQFCDKKTFNRTDLIEELITEFLNDETR